MEVFKTLIVILLSSVLVNNYVLSRFLGICPFLGVSKKLNQAVGMGISVTAVMLLATAVTWPIQYLLLDKVGLGYMQTRYRKYHWDDFDYVLDAPREQLWKTSIIGPTQIKVSLVWLLFVNKKGGGR